MLRLAVVLLVLISTALATDENMVSKSNSPGWLSRIISVAKPLKTDTTNTKLNSSCGIIGMDHSTDDITVAKNKNCCTSSIHQLAKDRKAEKAGIINKSERNGRGVIANLGSREGSNIAIKNGHFGVYLSWKNVHVKIPSHDQKNISSITLDIAWDMITSKSKARFTPASRKSSIKTAKHDRRSSGVNLPLPPKRPLNAYLYFCAEKRAENSKSVSSLREISQELSKLWSKLGLEKDGRSKYESLAAEAKTRYDKEIESWNEECSRLRNKLQNNGMKQLSDKGNYSDDNDDNSGSKLKIFDYLCKSFFRAHIYQSMPET